MLGQSFTAAGAAALGDRREAEVPAILDGLVAKQVLARDDDPRSPERGQYVLPPGAAADGRVRHAVAPRPQGAPSGGRASTSSDSWRERLRDIAEVLASHYLEAIRADPDAEDAADLRAKACETLAAAGRAAASLALGPEAQRYLQHAAELAEATCSARGLLEQAGRRCGRAATSRPPSERLARAIALHERAATSLGGPAAVAASPACCGIRVAREEARELLERFRPATSRRPTGHPRRGARRARRHAACSRA